MNTERTLEQLHEWMGDVTSRVHRAVLNLNEVTPGFSANTPGNGDVGGGSGSGTSITERLALNDDLAKDHALQDLNRLKDVTRQMTPLVREARDIVQRWGYTTAGEYEPSFRHYAQGNAIRRAQLHYSADDTSARVRYIREHYTAEFFAARAGAGSPAPDPIFVVGLPRAGSTLIEQILSSHSQVEGTMELPEITSITRLLRRQGEADEAMPYHAALATLDADALRALGERYLAHTRIQRKTAAPLFIDKMPNNFMHVDLIHLMLPNAKIIDARRHPLACGFSVFKQHFARGQNFSYDLGDVGRYYRDYVALMAHFDAVLPGRVHRVAYERMVDDTEGEVRRLLDYCGLPFEAACLRFFENTRPVRTASSEQVRRPIYREGVDHWRHYMAWLGPLASALGPVLESYPDAPEGW